MYSVLYLMYSSKLFMFCKHEHCCVNRLRVDLIVIHVVLFKIYFQVCTVSEKPPIRTHKPPIRAHKLRRAQYEGFCCWSKYPCVCVYFNHRNLLQP